MDLLSTCSQCNSKTKEYRSDSWGDSHAALSHPRHIKAIVLSCIAVILCVLAYVLSGSQSGTVEILYEGTKSDPNSVFSRVSAADETQHISLASSTGQGKLFPADNHGNSLLSLTTSYYGDLTQDIDYEEDNEDQEEEEEEEEDWMSDGDMKSFYDWLEKPISNTSVKHTFSWEYDKRKIHYTTFMSLTPPHYLPNYKSPCWEESAPSGGKPSLYCLPYLYLAGFPKSGTTELYQKLVTHPQIYRADRKEPHWWTRRRFKKSKKSSMFFYLKKFSRAVDRIQGTCTPSGPWCYHDGVTIDGSASTMWDNDKWELFPENSNVSEPGTLTLDHIHHITPRAKFLIILRNPVDRLYSDYMYFRSHTSPEEFHDRVLTTLHALETCLKTHSLSVCAFDKQIRKYVRLNIGLYSIYIEKWLARFPRDQLHVVRLEDYSTNKDAELVKIFDFLDVDRPDQTYFEEITTMSDANSNKKKKKKKGPMLPQTKQILTEFYAPYNKQLALLLEDDRYLWNS